ncbi:glycoside hydrolase family 48 protein [Streptomonospora litoralis]|uniref:Exoglucanase B n=1 Tax=Streptomonospora litoralis TaxID=2498135 RepID=A0A4V0ZKC6_9ACTN|nr:glycoside hydrolase family 48 protein [Streptomonospora litoralis]QBI56512.1 Exoglucanase B precursor [Streptomonospora litoralis]
MGSRLLTRWPLGRLLAGGLAAGLVAALAPTSPAFAATECSVDYEITNEWGSGFTANVTLNNEGDPVPGWTLGWAFPDGQQVTNGWSGDFSQSGADVTVTGPGWNPDLESGESVTVGFQGSLSGGNGEPAEFTLNGSVCGGGGTPENQPPEVSLTSPADGSTFLSGEDIELAADASDGDGSVEQVVFEADGTEIGTDSSAPYTATWSGAETGPYSVTATAVDDAGAETTSDPTAVEVIDEPEIVATPANVSVRQGGEVTFDVTLSNAPDSAVDVGVSRTGGSSDLSVSSGGSLTFTADNYDTEQEVTVSSADNGGSLASAVFTASGDGYGSTEVEVTEIDASTSDYEAAFLEQYEKIKDPASGYFREFENGLVPYHSVETLIVEAPDHGHNTTSEAFSYYLWLEASYGRVTGEWGPFNDAWTSLEEYIIPGTEDQPTNGSYDPSSPATYIPEQDTPQGYPSPLDDSVPVGEDPLAEELSSTYGTDEVYGMHWLLDVDNTYGYGFCGDGTDDAPAYINTFQRGSQESVWETVPHPSCETFDHGGENGFLDLYTDDDSYAQQWRYTNAPDADARAVQVAYLANKWAEEQGNADAISGVVDDAAKMGDYLRYSMYDKYFKEIGDCVGAQDCAAGQGKNSAHYLMSWYYAWGGAMESAEYPWAWRIGGSSSHQGYQNPMAAYALSESEALQPDSPTAAEDWSTSMDRQLEFMQWLQSSEGGLAGGATNSWAGSYEQPPSDVQQSQFYGMYYDWQPVWHDPPSNNWFGFQVWGMERVAQLYYETGNERAGQILEKWVPWAIEHTDVGSGGEFAVPGDMEWSGQPDTWDGSYTGNPDLHVEVVSQNQDVGVAASLSKTLLYYAAASGDTDARTTGEGLLDALIANEDDIGITVPEQRGDYERFDDEVYVPEGFSGTMPNGDAVEPGATFTSIRSFYRDDPQWPKVQEYLENPDGEAPTFTYHRFWSQAEIATAFATHDNLFG